MNPTVDKIDLVGAQEANLVALPAARLSPDRQLATDMVVERVGELNVEAALRDRTGSALDVAKLASNTETEVGTVNVAEQGGTKTGESLGGTELAVLVTVLQVVGFGWSRPKLGATLCEEDKLVLLEVLTVHGKSIDQRKLGRTPGVLVKVPRDTESSHGKRVVARRCFGDSWLLMFCLSVVVTINATDCVWAQFGGSGI